MSKHIDSEISYLAGTVMRENHVMKDGYFEYTNGLTDAVIAAKFGVTAEQIGRLRVKLFGKVRPYDNGPMVQVWDTIKKLTERVDMLQARVDHLEHELGVKERLERQNGIATLFKQ